ncbi:MAG: 5-formyltetrahydrofolate cyclo-ligase [Cohaesibacter sp.]|jgi:5-formyltetrahydrofolate cyclo-ligase|nr:5-formyltetrahydrofolate cyclo-ligase [Cohaesibacter sp.]
MDDEQLRLQKQALRAESLAKRDRQSEQDRQLWSQQAAAHLLSHLAILPQTPQLPHGIQGATVSLFWPIRSEIDSLLAAGALRQQGCQIALPVVLSKTDLEFRLWREDDPLVAAGYGSKGPAQTAPVVLPDCLVMPLAAFDNERNRMGYGAGFYDRYIGRQVKSEKKPLLIGLAFECQKLDKVPVGRYDQPLDWIVTEAGIL